MVKDALLDRSFRLLDALDFAEESAAREAEHREEIVRLLRALFDVVDSFDRFLAGAAHDANRRIVDANLATVQLIAKQLDRALRQAGVEQISALGTVLDSNFHEVVEVRQSKSTEDDFVVEEDDVVVEIVNRGYVWKGITLRPARVVVAAARRGK